MFLSGRVFSYRNYVPNNSTAELIKYVRTFYITDDSSIFKEPVVCYLAFTSACV